MPVSPPDADVAKIMGLNGTTPLPTETKSPE